MIITMKTDSYIQARGKVGYTESMDTKGITQNYLWLIRLQVILNIILFFISLLQVYLSGHIYFKYFHYIFTFHKKIHFQINNAV